VCSSDLDEEWLLKPCYHKLCLDGDSLEFVRRITYLTQPGSEDEYLSPGAVVLLAWLNIL
jgi:hypothetical protein